MEEVVKKYQNNEITVSWEPSKCIHSTKCWKNLVSVFNPKNRPWINIEGASSEEIMKTIDKCPSKALSYYKNGEEPQIVDVETENIIEMIPNGPLMVYGNIILKKDDGTSEKKTKLTAFCRCGASTNKPFCDGSHKKINFIG